MHARRETSSIAAAERPARPRPLRFALLASFVASWSAWASAAEDPPAVAPERPHARSSGGVESVPFAPGAGKILHFHGDPFGDDLLEHDYTRALGPNAAPIGESIWFDVPGPRGVSRLLGQFENAIARLAASGRMLNLTLAFDDGAVDGFSTARDLEYATTDAFDADVRAIAEVIARHRVKTLLRIGGEVNGDWEGHHPYVFPAAYRKVVAQFKAAGARQVAFVFCVEPNGDPDVFAVDGSGRAKWYPGDDVVDWIGIDLFQVESFAPIVDGAPPRPRGRALKRGVPRKIPAFRVTESVLAYARAHDKPVFLGEVAPVPHSFVTQVDDPDGAAAARVFESWFAPFLRFLDEHPEIQGVSYCGSDFARSDLLADWGDSRIQLHPEAVRRWREELSTPRWVHAKPDESPGR